MSDWDIDGPSTKNGYIYTIEALRAENAKLIEAARNHEQAMGLYKILEAVAKEQRADNEQLRQAMHDIYEVYAGSEGTAGMKNPALYLQGCVQEMAYIAGKHKRVGGQK